MGLLLFGPRTTDGSAIESVPPWALRIDTSQAPGSPIAPWRSLRVDGFGQWLYSRFGRGFHRCMAAAPQIDLLMAESESRLWATGKSCPQGVESRAQQDGMRVGRTSASATS